ncbi:multidrug transporter subunit MdtA [Erwinia sp. OLTSP20]|uniref:MdtA/MuxA family multidrug efflux RND transporter periplasmic adaptor subunit n=1 Tax=unclassified Erwinia TaxID=2622719 RepID=UPI000C1772D0|nr:MULTISPECIES: MdtA/MuxA family multidrug efflux RND transporter periplasmic adaptor subunit [unclassified Erwinia]PIJ50590.1 multidrug transporter subunit MdtA [Erwinia sp. OAMSP11]PIJ72908.1 multidrug transporter subunit MdtA [Erwinia sp. OLSSP12]PIJ82238.1 multidrug transporter subunit MdtA [Erwinia sp. OLCASP19]PIJ84791.1 multidrug transporter subunit MdtA [Erwinia sp. OLMTSP26]PIJ86756.1 multidrug transporter subunit MdtA [Erwinia sp. OLMDSP33]
MNGLRRSTKTGLLILIVVLIFGGLYGWMHLHSGDKQPADAPTNKSKNKGGRRGAMASLPPVQAASVQQQSVPRYISGLGTVNAAGTVTVRSRVEGYLQAIHFHEGEYVQAGQLLAEIDPRPFQVALMQARGQLAKDQATLANARRDLSRYQQLAKTHLVAAQDVDTKRALVAETLGSITADQGSVASAQLNLDYSRISAPIAGRVGLRQVDVGNYISSADSNGIVVITQTHPVDVVFSVPENDISDIVAARKAGNVLSVEAWDRGNQTLLASGSLLSMDNQIDTTTGTLKLKARFTNDNDALFPNQFVNARLKINTLQNALVIPTSALQMGNEGHFVWVINSDNKVSKKQVTTGIQDSRIVVISAGLNAGDRVVTDGVDRLTDGSGVEVVAAQTAGDNAAKRLPVKGESD